MDAIQRTKKKKMLIERSKNLFKSYETVQKDKKQDLKFKIRQQCHAIFEDAINSDELVDLELAEDALKKLFEAKNCLIESMFYPKEVVTKDEE
jgi:hypothetical protein